MTTNKIKSLDELAVITRELKQRGKTVVQCHGCFDLMHPGHIQHFEAAKKQGDVLIVTVTSDDYVNKGPDRPVFPEQSRMRSIAALHAVDYVALSSWPTAEQTIRLLKPDVYVKGQDVAKSLNSPTSLASKEKDVVHEHGGRFHITNEPIVFSSSSLLVNHFSSYPEETRQFLNAFKNKYSQEDVLNYLKSIQNKRILVIGDTIIDQYHYSHGVGSSMKGNMMSVKFDEEEVFAGGVLVAANTIAGFSEKVDLVTCLGENNSFEEFIRLRLASNIRSTFFYRKGAITTIIRRYLEKIFLFKMFQVYFTDDSPLPDEEEKAVLAYLEAALPNYDAVIVFDYGFGFLTPRIVNLICRAAKVLCVNTQTNSMNRGFNFITKYPRADFICVDESEMRLAVSDKHGAVEDLLPKIACAVGASRVIVTLGSRGSLAYDNEQKKFYKTPVLSTKVVDRVGAGDAYFSLAAPLVVSAAPMDMVGFLGNITGAIAVTIVGNREHVRPEEVMRFAQTLMK